MRVPPPRRPCLRPGTASSVGCCRIRFVRRLRRLCSFAALGGARVFLCLLHLALLAQRLLPRPLDRRLRAPPAHQRPSFDRASDPASNQIILASIDAPFSAAARRGKDLPRVPLRRLDGDDALRLGALRPVDRLELHVRALGERLETLSDDRRVMDEHVLAPVSRGDEPIPLRVVEPLDGSGCHTKHLLHHERTGRGSALCATSTRSVSLSTVPGNGVSLSRACGPAHVPRARRYGEAGSTGRSAVGEIHVHEFITLDGVIDAPTWTFEYIFDPKMGEAIRGLTKRARGILLGRTTYEMFEPAWSTRTADDDPGAPFFNDTTKYVVSGTLTSPSWRNSEVVGPYHPKTT